MRAIVIAVLFAALTVAPALAQPARLATELVSNELDMPLLATAPAGDPRLFVVEQGGKVKILVDGKLLPSPFLDLGSKVSSGGEQGLLALAFHPDYASNGLFFVDYTDVNGDTRIAGYTVSADPNAADPDSETLILAIDQPFPNHNGGALVFGPDGYLYIGMGDGGAGGDPLKNGQNPDVLLGKLLRLDVDSSEPYAIPPANPFATGGGKPEIFALGVRNPWRIDFDGDDIYIADVGQESIEETDVVTTADAGANLGWSAMEGDTCFRRECSTDGFILPIHQYTHDDGGCSITGGYVYRGKAMPELGGQYFFADLCDGRVRSLGYADGKAGPATDWSNQLGLINGVTSFGEDSAGELYITTFEGNLLKLVRAK